MRETGTVSADADKKQAGFSWNRTESDPAWIGQVAFRTAG